MTEQPMNMLDAYYGSKRRLEAEIERLEEKGERLKLLSNTYKADVEEKSGRIQELEHLLHGEQRENGRYEDILRSICHLLELPQSESGPCDDSNAYTRAIESLQVDYTTTEAERVEHMKARYKAEAENERLRKELEAVNNEFGSQTADWPGAWERVAELKRTLCERWREIERLHAKANIWITLAGQHAAALDSIAKNTCCDRCQEAALVAQAALAVPSSKGQE